MITTEQKDGTVIFIPSLERIVQPRSDQRKMQRLSLQLPVHFTNGASCTLRSFNYRFFSAKEFHGDIASGAVVTFYTKSNIEVIL